MNSSVNAEPLEQRMLATKTDSKTGEVTKVYAYKHRNPVKNFLWHLRHGKYGERISRKEAAKFEPQ